MENNVAEKASQERRVTCGGHFAADCAGCTMGGHGEPYCNGECIWLAKRNGGQNEGACLSRPDFADATGCGLLDKIEPIDPSNLKIHCGNIRDLAVGERLAEGSHKDVYRGQWTDGKSYAVKMRKSATEIHAAHSKNFFPLPPENSTLQEATLLHVNRDSPNIMPLTGYCDGVIVTPLGVGGDVGLLALPNKDVTSLMRMQYAIDVSSAVAQLHSTPGGPVVHGDLHPGQLMWLDDGKIVLGDLDTAFYAGMSPKSADGTGVKDVKCKQKTNVGTKWLAPEQVANRPFDEKADVYALGNMVWSLLAAEGLFPELDQTSAQDAVQHGRRPDLGPVEQYPPDIAALLKECWAVDGRDRPDAKGVVMRLRAALSVMKE